MEIFKMHDAFTFHIDESWEENLARLKDYLNTQDSECTELLFEHLEILMANEGTNSRRDFNQRILTALDTLAEAEIQGSKT